MSTLLFFIEKNSLEFFLIQKALNVVVQYQIIHVQKFVEILKILYEEDKKQTADFGSQPGENIFKNFYSVSNTLLKWSELHFISYNTYDYFPF